MKALFRVCIQVFMFFHFMFVVSAQTNLHTSDKFIDSILSSAKNISNTTERVSMLNRIAGEYRYTKNTMKLLKKAIEISLEVKSDKLLADSYYSMGNFYFYNTRLDSAMVFFDKSTEYLKNLDEPSLKASLLMSKSGVYRKYGDRSSSLAVLIEAKNIMDKMDTLKLNKVELNKYKGGNLVLNNTLANYYNQMEEYDKALLYYDLAFESALKLGSKVNAGIILSNKGDLYLNLGNYQKALELQIEGKSMKIEAKAPMRIISYSDLNIGIANLKLKKYDDALFNFNTALDFYQKENIEPLLYEVLYYRGTLFIEMEKYSDAAKDCETSKRIATEQNDLEFVTKACECLYNTYKSSGNFEKALLNHEQYLMAKDSVFNKENVMKQTQMEMQYEFNKKQELQDLTLKAKEKESQLYSYLAIAGLCIATLLGFFFYKNRKKNILLAKQKTLLEASVDEKNILLKETHHRVKNSFQIVSSLLYLQSENMQDKEAKIAIKEAENRVRSMVLIHQKLYNKDQLIGIDSKEYFTDLINDIFESHQFQQHPLKFNLDVEPLVLDVETITPIGLILNELIVNVLKHAFPKIDESSLLKISFKKVENTLLLKVIDNGKGLENDIKDTSFGIKLMKALSKKLKATLHFNAPKEKGTEAILTIHKFNIL